MIEIKSTRYEKGISVSLESSMYDDIKEIEEHFGNPEGMNIMCWVNTEETHIETYEEANLINLWIQSDKSESSATVMTQMTLENCEVLANQLLKMVEWKRSYLSNLLKNYTG